MPDRGTDARDLFRVWLDQQKALLDGSAAQASERQAEALYGAWARMLQAWSGAADERAGGPDASPFDPAGWLRGEGAGGMADLMRWLEGPEMADPLAPLRRQLAGTREWVAYLTATEQMRAVLAEGWLTAFRGFVHALAGRDRAREAEGEGPPPLAEIERLWERHAADAIAATYRSPAFLAAQRDLMRAELDLRGVLAARVEAMGRAIGMPTRAEIDDLHAKVHALERAARAARAAARDGGA